MRLFGAAISFSLLDLKQKTVNLKAELPKTNLYELPSLLVRVL